MISRLGRDESLALLRGARMGRLGCVAEGYPYVVPINYVFDGECVVSHTLPGRKLSAMRENPRVCVQVDEVADQLEWKSVLAYGTFEEVTNAAERGRALGLLLTFFPRLTPVESLIAEDGGAPAPVVYRVRLDRVTGIREG